MISPELFAEMRRLFFAEHWKVGTIAAQLQVHHETVRQVIGSERFRNHLTFVRPSRLDPYLPFIREVLEKYPTLRATRLHEMLRLRGYQGSPTQVRRVLRPLRPARSTGVYLRLRTMAGEQAQVDWGHFGRIRVGKGFRPLSCFVMVLSYSRAIHALFTLDQTLESFHRGHVEAFSTFGGTARCLLYDNLKSAVLERQGSAIHFHPRLLELAGHYHFAPRPCAPARGNEKGRVERQIQYLRHSFFAARIFRNVEDLNAQFCRWRDEIAHQRAHPEEPEKTVQDMLAAERAQLLPLPEHPFETDTVRPVSSGKTPYVRFDRNLYSIPYELARKPLTLIAGTDRIRIMDGVREVASHARSFDSATVIEDPAHVEALVRAKKNASGIKARDRLRIAVPICATLIERLAERGENLGHHTARLLKLLDEYGPPELTIAVSEVLERDALGSGSVAHILETRRRRKGLKPPIGMHLPDHLQNLDVAPHNLEDYDDIDDNPPW